MSESCEWELSSIIDQYGALDATSWCCVPSVAGVLRLQPESPTTGLLYFFAWGAKDGEPCRKDRTHETNRDERTELGEAGMRRFLRRALPRRLP
jgi:hypothetical protein